MTIFGTFLHHLPRCRRTLERIGASLVLAGLSAAAVAFYFYACLCMAQLQQLGPDQLMRAVSGI